VRNREHRDKEAVLTKDINSRGAQGLNGTKEVIQMNAKCSWPKWSLRAESRTRGSAGGTAQDGKVPRREKLQKERRGSHGREKGSGRLGVKRTEKN